MKLVSEDDPMLRKVIPKYEGERSELRDIAFQMFQFMVKSGGMGLAANQVGLNIRMFVMRGEKMTGSFRDGYVMINPEIHSEYDYRPMTEGCLTYGDQRIVCSRPRGLKVAYYNLKNGVACLSSFVGVHAQCVHHEIDHLNGLTMFDRETDYSKETRKQSKRSEVLVVDNRSS